MKNTLQQIIDWNKKADFTNFERHLETSLLAEEFSEYNIALKEKDMKEILDAYCDMIFITTGTLFKLGFTADQLERAMQEVQKSNNSKFFLKNGEYKCIKDSRGKVQKPSTYKEPDFTDILKEL